jgi:hypothetical protein
VPEQIGAEYKTALGERSPAQSAIGIGRTTERLIGAYLEDANAQGLLA